MEEYQAGSWIARLPLFLLVPAALIADYASDLFDWAYDLYFALLFLCTFFYLVTPYKYYPVFTTLCIDEKWIRKRLFGLYTTRRISRERVQTGGIILHGTRYVVFSKVDIPSKKRDILRLVYRRKALLFPWDVRLKMDFPELLDGNKR